MGGGKGGGEYTLKNGGSFLTFFFIILRARDFETNEWPHSVTFLEVVISSGGFLATFLNSLSQTSH